MAFPIVTAAELIGQLYVGYFGRAADPAGLDYWVNRYNDGMSLLAIANSFAVQPEATALYSYLAAPSLGDPQAFIASIYGDLFNRAPDAAGLAYWVTQLTVQGTPPGQMVLDIISGAQGSDRTTIENKTHVAVDHAQASHSVLDAHAVVASVTADPTTVAAVLGIGPLAFESGLMTNMINTGAGQGTTGSSWHDVISSDTMLLVSSPAIFTGIGTFNLGSVSGSTTVHSSTDTLLVDPAQPTLGDIPVFIGTAANFGQALALLAGGGATQIQVVYQQDIGALWIDANNDGLLNARDLEVFLDLSGLGMHPGPLDFGNLPGLVELASGASVTMTAETRNQLVGVNTVDLVGVLHNVGADTLVGFNFS